MPKYAGLYIGAFTLFVIGGGFLLHLTLAPKPVGTASAQVACSVASAPRLEAQSAALFDITKRTFLFQKNADAQMPLASLTKLMTVLVASRILDPASLVSVRAEALTPEGDSGLLAGELWEVQDLIDFTLITSSNDGAHALALAASAQAQEPMEAFIARMNALAGAFSLQQTYFLNDTGLDVSPRTAGAYGSAEDIARLLLHIYEEEETVFSGSVKSEKTFVSASGVPHTATHTSAIAGVLSGEIVSKTGFTDLAGGNLAVVAEPGLGHPVVLVVLGSSKEGRDTDLQTLYDYAKKSLKRATLCGI